DRQLMWIGTEPVFRIGDADLLKQLDRSRPRGRAAQASMQQQYFANLLVDGVHRIEGRHRLLKHERGRAAADRRHRALAEVDDHPGGRPKPRKSSAGNVITEADTMNGRNVMVATSAFGSR